MIEKIKNKLINDGFSVQSLQILKEDSFKFVGILNDGNEDFLVKAFKLNFDASKDKRTGPYWVSRKELIDNEKNVLEKRSIDFSSVESSDLHILIIPWVTGTDSYEYITEQNKGLSENKQVDNKLFLWRKVTLSLHSLHSLGILHGDVQPNHFIVGDTGVNMIDFELSGSMPSGFANYPGQLIHYASPEVAKLMSKEQKIVPYSIESEIYSLGSTLYYLYTGDTSTFYGENGLDTPFLTKAEKISQNGFRSYEQSKIKDKDHWDLLSNLMNKEKHKRPSSLTGVIEIIDKLISKR
jgi:serine/threonine protein kinase